MPNTFDDIDKMFVETVSIIILNTHSQGGSEYQRYYLDGYAKAYSQLTGRTIWQLKKRVNKAIQGSGKEWK